MILEQLYNYKLMEYKLTGKRTRPDKLLAMLLLPQRDNYEPLKVEEGKFYNTYKEEIDKNINKVINDFEISRNDIINYIESKGVLCNDYEHDKIWFVFSKGFGTMHWGIMYRQNNSSEEIYSEMFGDNDLILINSYRDKYQKMYEMYLNNPKLFKLVRITSLLSQRYESIISGNPAPHKTKLLK